MSIHGCFKLLAYRLFITSVLICLLTPVLVQADNHKDLYDAALECKENGDYQNAIRLFNESIRLKPRNPYAFHHLAHTYEEIGEFDQAIQAFDQAIALDPNDAKHYRCKANLYYDLASYEDAIEEFKAAINLNRDDPWAYHNLAHSYEAIGDYERALFCLQKAIDLGPEEKAHRSCYDRVSQIKENIEKGIPRELQIPKHEESDDKIHEDGIVIESENETRIVFLERNIIVRYVLITAAILTVIRFLMMLMRWM